ncbi:MAG TPA: AAA family ATPase [Polyangiaceae bacterium]|nr:AAA family ATPase [Polyangiaceae bacterium]
MYVKRVEIENIRGFGSGERGVDLDLERPDGSLAGWTVLAGRNGAGKTTFLRAIALALAGRRVARVLQESFAGWLHHEAPEAHLETQIRCTSNRDHFQEKHRTSLAHLQVRLQWRHIRARTEPMFSTRMAYPSALKPPGGPWADEPKGWFVAGYGPFRRLSGHASDAQRLMAAPNRISRLVSLFREDASLVECVAWLKAIYLRRLEKKPGAAELEDAVLRLLDDGLLPDGMKLKKVDSDGLWVTQGRVTLPLHELSDGYRTMVALVLDIARQLHDCFGKLPIVEKDGALAVDLPGVVLIDEVDAHLHVSWQQRVGFWLKRRFPKIQFLVTTHSPFVCQAADPRGLIRLPGPGEDRKAEHVSDDLFKRVVNGTADEAALSDLFGLERTVSEEAAAKRREFSELEAKVILDEASAKERRRHAQLQDELKLSPSGEVTVALQSVANALNLPTTPKGARARTATRKGSRARSMERMDILFDSHAPPAKARARTRGR